MPDRTEWDEAVDRAIERLIDEDTEAFALVTTEAEDIHLVKAADPDEELLAVWMLVEALVREADEAGMDLRPGEVLAAGAEIAASRGLLEDAATFQEFR